MSMIEAQSLGDLLRKQAKAIPTKTAMMKPDKASFVDISYQELAMKARTYAGALIDLGIKRGDKVAILSDNCVEWAFTDWACSSLGVTTVPIYATLPADQAQYIVRDSEAVLVVGGTKEHLAKVENVRTILLKDGEGSLDDLASGNHLSEAELDGYIDQIQPNDLWTIIYTSGTTGQPKGAMLTHAAPLHVCRSAISALQLDDRDVFLCFLPMSHVYERIAGQCLPIAMGGTIAYAKSLASLVGDMQKVRPTIMLCVPRFLESFRERVIDGLAKEPPFRQKLLKLAMAQALTKSKGGFAPLAGILDSLVLSKARAKTGGRLRFFVSGGAALPGYVSEFFSSLNLKVLQGYGLTETGGGTFINHPDRNDPSTVGESLDMEIKIAEDGEILLRGPAVMTGYYNLPKETAEVIDLEGWFHTGDIGQMVGKRLQITDRKKNIIVLGNGKNVAPQPIEDKLKSSAMIAEAVVFGDSMDYCVALIVPNADAVRKQLGLADGVDFAQDASVKALIKSEVDAVNKNLASFEKVKKFAILSDPFTIESGELTPTMKVKRKVVRERYAAVLQGLA